MVSQKMQSQMAGIVNRAPLKLPRTGIEQPFMKDIPHFIDTHREFERIAIVNVSRISPVQILN